MRKANLFLVLCMLVSVTGYLQEKYDVQVTSVSVWVKAVDGSGKAVEHMSESDFEVFEDGERVDLSCFEEENSFSKTDAASQIALPRQKFVLFLDLYNTTPIEYGRIKPQLQSFVHSLWGKNHELMLAAVTPDRRMGVIAPFTADLNRVRILLTKATANPMRDVHIEQKYDELFRVFEGATGDSLEDIVMHAAHQVESLANQEKSESEFSLSALESFAGYLSEQSSHERIVMLLVSGGFSRDPGRRFYEIIDRLALRALNNDPLKFTGFKRSNFDFERELRKTVGKLSRSNVTIYTLDTRGTARRKEYQESLISIADETGGTSFYNSLNFKEGLNRVMQDLQHQYVLCYTPPFNQKSGVYHKIKVSSKREQVDLRYRNGYFN